MIPILLPQSLGWDALLQESSERRADAQENNDPAHCYDDRRSQTARSHQDVKHQNVHNDGSKQRQRERNVPIDQEQDCRDELEQKHDNQIIGSDERSNELTSRSRRQRAANEVKEPVQSKDQKDKAQKVTGDESSDFHVSWRLELSFYYATSCLRVSRSPN